MLKRVFTKYSVLGFVLAALLPLIVEFTRVVSLGRLGATSGFLLSFLPSVLAGWFFAAKAPLPGALFARLLPLFSPPLLLALLYVPRALTGNIIPGISMSAITSGYFWAFVLVLLGPSWGSFYPVFLIRSEWRRRSAAKLRGTSALLGIILLCAGLAAAAHAIGVRYIIGYVPVR